MSDDKRFEDPLARMAREREERQEQPVKRERRRPQKKKKEDARFADPLEGKTKEAVMASYTESARAGKYIRHSFTWTPGQLAKIREVAQALNLSMNATARWLMDQGLALHLEQGVEPELEVKEVRSEPRLREW